MAPLLASFFKLNKLGLNISFSNVGWCTCEKYNTKYKNKEYLEHFCQKRKREKSYSILPFLSLTSTSFPPSPYLAIPINLSLPHSNALFHVFSYFSPYPLLVLPHPNVSWLFCRPSTFLGVTWSPPVPPQGGPLLIQITSSGWAELAMRGEAVIEWIGREKRWCVCRTTITSRIFFIHILPSI